MRFSWGAAGLLFFTLIVAGVAGAAAPPVQEWTRSFAGRYTDDNYNVGYSIRHTVDGNYILVGEMGRKRGTSEIWLMKLDPAGNVLWEKTFGSSVTDAEGYDVALAGDGGFVLGGNTRNVNVPGQDVIVIQTDGNGGILWERTFRKGEVNNLTAIKATSDGGYIFTGVTDDQAWIVKLDGTGVVRWEQVHDTYMRASDVIQSGDGGYLVSIVRKDGFYLVRKLDGFGAFQWETRLNQKQIYTPTSDATLLQAGDGGYLVALHSAVDYRLYPWLVKLDGSGAISWEKQVGTDQLSYRSTGLVQTTDGGYAVLCRGICKTNGEGTTEWVFNRTSGNPNALLQASDGGFLLTGFRTRTSTTDLWVSKLSAAPVETPLETPALEMTTARPAFSPPASSSPAPEVTPLATASVPPETASPPATLPATHWESPPRDSPISILPLVLALSIFIYMRKIKQ